MGRRLLEKVLIKWFPLERANPKFKAKLGYKWIKLLFLLWGRMRIQLQFM